MLNITNDPLMTAPEPYWLQAEDWHTAGEPFRIVTPPAHLLPASVPSVPALRQTIMNTPNHPLDVLRQTLCLEPRGHADMYGCFLLPPPAGADLAVLFWHKDGFSTACGHGTIALGAWAVHHRKVDAREGVNEVVIDVPSGRVRAEVTVKEGRTAHVDFVNVPGYVLRRNVRLASTGATGAQADLAFAGAVYASLPAPLPVTPGNYDALIALARRIKAELAPGGATVHGDYDLYGVIFFEDVPAESGLRQRNVTVFADGEVDRSPCGSGTAARVACLLAEGRMDETATFTHDSIVGTTFVATIDRMAESPTEYPGCVARVRGRANLVARSEFYIDPADPVYPGFCFR